ncbi:MAG: phage holin family protein [Ferruginibacter sp.]
MITLILELLAEAAVIILLAAIMPDVKIRNYSTALGVAIVVALLNVTIGFLLRFPLNLVTLFFLGFIVRLIVTTLMIKLADKLFSGFEVKGWLPAFIIAVCMALAGSLISSVW